jgi:hypothetical protein
LVADLSSSEVTALVEQYGMRLVHVDTRAPIPGSYWGDTEAGLVGDRLYARADTPAHSLLHELAHFVCMDGARRARLSTDAGGDDDEECGVCYLQILLAAHFSAFDSAKCLDDMDAWGYSFREGSARAWFYGDGRDARRWLLAHGLIDAKDRPTFRCR